MGDIAEWFSLFNPAGDSELPLRATPPAASQAGSAELAQLVERWVRRVGLGGDSRRGVARLDIGQGRFSGAELLIVAEAGHVSVELSLPGGMGDDQLSQRLLRRLQQRGFAADVVVR